VDQETKQTLERLHNELKLDEEGPYDQQAEDWRAQRAATQHWFDLDSILGKLLVFIERVSGRLRGRGGQVEAVEEVDQDRTTGRACQPGDEMEQELTDAWNLFTRGAEVIPSKQIGYVLRILGQNPTEDDIVEMVMKADCDWEGSMNRSDFLSVGQEILKKSCDQMDDVRSAFRVFDLDNDGSISKEELREAMVNFGQRCTKEEFNVMFREADKNQNGRIDFDEFVDMMLPSASAI